MVFTKLIVTDPTKCILWLLLVGFPTLTYACFDATPSSLQITQGDSASFSVQCDAACVATVDASSGDTSLATVTPASQTIGATAKDFSVTAVTAGSTQVNVSWSCAAYGTGSSYVSLNIVAPPGLSGGSSSGNKPGAASVKDPISTFSGELYNQFPADLDLGGPMALKFSRYYGSALSTDGVSTGILGLNWRHNFDWTLNNTGTDIDILNTRGALIEFTKDGSNWVQSGNSVAIYQLVEAGGEFTLLDIKNELFYVFSNTGQLTRIDDGKGNQHSLTYNGSNNINQISDGVGRSLSFTYTGNKLSSVSDGNRTVSFSYNADEMINSTSSRGKTTSYTYASTGLMSSLVKPEANISIAQTFDGSDRVTSQTDGENNTTTLSYGANQVTTITSPLAEVTRHTHSAAGELMKTEDPNGGTVMLMSDSKGRRNSITDRLGNTTTLTYHTPSGKLASITNAEGNSSSYTYTGRTVSGLTVYDLTGITRVDGTTKSLVYDASGNISSRTDPSGNTVTFSHNSKGQRLTHTNKLGGITNHSYNADDTLASVTDPTGNTTAFSYDASMRPILTTFSDTNVKSFTYDNANHLLTATNERNNTLSLAYDDNDNLISITNPLGNSQTFGYDNNDRVITITDPMASVVTIAYDQAGRVTAITDEIGNVTTQSYDALDQLTSVTNPLGHIWGISYDLEGGLASRTNPLGNTITYVSDSMGRTTQITSPLGNQSQLSYDNMGRIITTTNPLGNVTTYSRDAMGFVSGLTLNDIPITTTYVRNPFGQLLSINDPNGNDWQRSYDNAGRLISSTDPLGNSSTVSYDNRNRVLIITYPNSMGSLTLGYDSTGNTTSRAYSDGTNYNYSFDATDHLISADGISNSYDANGRKIDSNGIAMSYDARGRITSMTLAAGKSVTYNYDANDQLISVIDWAGGTTSFNYNAAGQLTAVTRPNSINRSMSYDDDSRLIAISEGANISISLTLDAKGQTVSAIRVLPQSLTAGGTTENNTYNSASQQVGHDYDAMGRTTLDTMGNYTWELASRLVSYSYSGSSVTATYDGLGQRLSKTLDGTTSNYVWNYALLLPSIMIEKQGSTDYRYYIRMPGGELLYSMDANSNSRLFYHFDEMGNTIFVSNDAGSTVESYTYTPFGLITSVASTQLDNLFTWQGESGVQDDGNGFYYIRARFYDANTGRFISRDPVERVKPRSVNPYQYSFANPLMFRDLTGRTPKGKVPEPQVPVSEIGGATTAVLGLGLKSSTSALAGSGVGLLGDSINLGIHLSEDEIDTGKVLEDVGVITVDIGSIGLTATAATAEAGALTGASIAGPAVVVYAIAKLGIVTYEAWWDLQAAEQRLEATKFANKLEKKKAARRKVERQAKVDKEIRDRHEEYLQKEQALRDEIKATEAAGKDAEALRKQRLILLAKILFNS